MKISEVAKDLNMSAMFLREWIASGTCPFGVCIRIKKSSRRTFHIDPQRLKMWKAGNL